MILEGCFHPSVTFRDFILQQKLNSRKLRNTEPCFQSLLFFFTIKQSVKAGYIALTPVQIRLFMSIHFSRVFSNK